MYQSFVKFSSITVILWSFNFNSILKKKSHTAHLPFIRCYYFKEVLFKKRPLINFSLPFSIKDLFLLYKWIFMIVNISSLSLYRYVCSWNTRKIINTHKREIFINISMKRETKKQEETNFKQKKTFSLTIFKSSRCLNSI
jgi:hypothetical protein